MAKSAYESKLAPMTIRCPVCKGEKQVGYLSSDNSKPPELGDCYRCNGTGKITAGLD